MTLLHVYSSPLNTTLYWVTWLIQKTKYTQFISPFFCDLFIVHKKKIKDTYLRESDIDFAREKNQETITLIFPINTYDTTTHLWENLNWNIFSNTKYFKKIMHVYRSVWTDMYTEYNEKKSRYFKIFLFYFLFLPTFFFDYTNTATRWMDGLSLLLFLLCVLKTDFFRFLYYYKLLLLSVSVCISMCGRQKKRGKKRNFFNWYCEASFHSVTYTSLSFLSV